MQGDDRYHRLYHTYKCHDTIREFLWHSISYRAVGCSRGPYLKKLFIVMIIIPAIDIIGGCCVRLTQGNFSSKKVYDTDPVEMAKQFEFAGIRRLHLVDLDGARSGAMQHLSLLERIATATSLSIDFGGGISSSQDVADVFSAGASMATIGSMAVINPALLCELINQYGSERFFIGADVLGKQVKVKGWSENGGVEIVSHLKEMIKIGASCFFCTDISKDGALEGPSLSLYHYLLEALPGIRLSASGGVSSLDDLALLDEAGCEGAIIGKGIYEGRFTLEELQKRFG
jgi:phosphoribosylformimino-5-aminoimidazole carboxamide ribotide isomerase